MSLFTNLEALLPMNNDWKDYSGNGNDGTATGATFDNGNKKIGTSSGSFATDDVVRISDVAGFDLAGAATVSSWVNGAAQSGKMISAQYDTGATQRGWFVSTGLVSTSKARITLSTDGSGAAGSIKVYESSLVVFNGLWNLIAFTFNAGTLKIYVNGVEDTSPNKVFDAAIVSIHDSTADVTLGASLNNNVAEQFYTGLIDQTTIHSRVLTDTEISDMYNKDQGIYLGESIQQGSRVSQSNKLPVVYPNIVPGYDEDNNLINIRR